MGIAALDVPNCDMRGDLHAISARVNRLELLDRNSGAEFLISAHAVLRLSIGG
jgi:hypothetical protein